MFDHHAVLIRCGYTEALSIMPHEYREEGADVHHRVGIRMGIDEVRALIADAYRTPLERDVRVFVLGFHHYTDQAQNALLKLFEEPPQTTRFVIATEYTHELIPTLRSRLMTIEHAVSTSYDTSPYEYMRTLTHGERLEEIALRITKKDEDWVEGFMRAAEVWGRDDRGALLSAVTRFRPYFSKTGAARKMILEHISLLIPAQS